MVNQRKKGQRGEYEVRDLLRLHTKLQWERVPASGALAYLKGDLWIPDKKCTYCVEVKFYEDSHFNDKILTNKSNHFVNWWNKIKVQAFDMDQKPLLFFKYNRSAVFVTTDTQPKKLKRYIKTNHLNAYTMVAKDWLENEDICWINE